MIITMYMDLLNYISQYSSIQFCRTIKIIKGNTENASYLCVNIGITFQKYVANPSQALHANGVVFASDVQMALDSRFQSCNGWQFFVKAECYLGVAKRLSEEFDGKSVGYTITFIG